MPKSSAWLFLLIAFCTPSMYGQKDSLDNLLSKSPEDTNKVMLYWKTGASVVYQDPQQSIGYFKKATALAAKLNYAAGMERSLNGTSFAYSINAQYDSGLHYINLAIPYAKKVGNINRLTLAFINRADAHSNLNNHTAALLDCDTAIQYAEKLPSSADALGRIHSIAAGIYVDQEIYAEAEKNMDKSLANFLKANNRRMIGQIYSDKADLFNKMNLPEKSLPFYYEAIRIGDSLQDIENLAAYYGGIAESYGKLKRYNSSKFAAKHSARLAQQTGNVMQEANAYLNLLTVLSEEKNLEEGMEYASRAYKIFSEFHDTMRMHITANSLAEVYMRRKNYEQAYTYQKISDELSDSLAKRKFSDEMVELQNSFEVKGKDREILLLNKEKELQKQTLAKQRFIITGVGVIALLVIGGLWLLVNRNKMRQRMKELELRNRIAADLHDEVGSSLSSIHMLSQMATKKITQGAEHDIIARMSANAKETMDKMGDIVWMIKPSETETGSLVQRMERFAYEIGSGKNIDVKLHLEELQKAKLSPQQRRNIYLIFKEAVNNAAKYSGSKNIHINTTFNNRELLLMIKDDGQGFDTTLGKKGNGLGNMQNRAQELGGKLEIGSAPNQGTTVTLSVPI